MSDRFIGKRRAVPSDIVVGAIVLLNDKQYGEYEYDDDDCYAPNGFCKKIIEEVYDQNDEFKAFCAEDGCRYGLDDLWTYEWEYFSQINILITEVWLGNKEYDYGLGECYLIAKQHSSLVMDVEAEFNNGLKNKARAVASVWVDKTDRDIDMIIGHYDNIHSRMDRVKDILDTHGQSVGELRQQIRTIVDGK